MKIGTAVLGDYSMAADRIRKSTRALFRAIRLRRQSPKEAAELCAKTLGTALAVMQGTLIEYGVIKKKLPLEEHITREFTPVKL